MTHSSILRNLAFGLALALALAAAPGAARATELRPVTIEAFNRYVKAAEARDNKDLQAGRFLIIDELPERDRQEEYARLQQGRIYVHRMEAQEDDKPIRVPHGLIHHWVGIVFVPGVTLDTTIAEMQDYADQPKKYNPTVRKSRVLEHDGNQFKTWRQLYRKQIVTVVINAEFDDVYKRLSPTQETIRSYSTRIAEVDDPGEPDEHEMPVGNDHGYVWRFYNYWHLEQKDGGVYVQVESIALSRNVPAIFAWLVNPLIKSIPRDLLSDMLGETRKAILERNAEEERKSV